MTIYKINKTKDIYEIEIKGHANYAPENEDIVCAGISMAVCMTANALDMLDLSCNILDFIHKKGYSLLSINTKSDIAVKLMDNLADVLDTLSKQYPKNIKFSK